MVGVELGAIGRVEHGQAAGRRRLLERREHGRIVGVPQARGPAVGEGREFPRGRVTEVALHVHGFMVADEGVHIAAGAPRLGLQAHQQVQDAAGVGRTIGNVAQLHQVGRTAAPAILGVDEARLAQHVVELAVVAVQVAEHHHPWDMVPARLGLDGGGDADRHRGEEGGEELDHGTDHSAGSAPAHRQLCRRRLDNARSLDHLARRFFRGA